MDLSNIPSLIINSTGSEMSCQILLAAYSTEGYFVTKAIFGPGRYDDPLSLFELHQSFRVDEKTADGLALLCKCCNVVKDDLHDILYVPNVAVMIGNANSELGSRYQALLMGSPLIPNSKQARSHDFINVFSKPGHAMVEIFIDGKFEQYDVPCAYTEDPGPNVFDISTAIYKALGLLPRLPDADEFLPGSDEDDDVIDLSDLLNDN